MASKQRASLRRRQKAKTDEKRVSEINENEEDADDFEMKSPSRQVKYSTSPSRWIPPGFRSPVQTASSSSRRKGSPGSGDTSLDDSSDVPCSQAPTPSKWSYLLPDFNSQPDGVVSEVLWDCASPDAVKYLRRVQKDNSNIKELIKFVKEPSTERRSQSPPFQLQFLRTSLQKHLLKKKKPPDMEKRKARKLAQKRKQKQEDKERERQLFGQMLSAVAKREELEAKLREEKQSEASTNKLDTVATNTETEEEEEEEGWENDEDWEDDDLFENNSFIIAATQNPYKFLQENASKTSTPVLAAAQQREACASENHDGSDCVDDDKSSMEDSQSPEMIPPTYVTRRSSKVSTNPRILFGASVSKEKGGGKTVIGQGNDKTIVGLQKKDKERGTLSASAEKMKPPNSPKQLPSLKSAKDVGRKAGSNQVRSISQASHMSKLSSVSSVQTNAVSSRDTLNDNVMSDDGVSDDVFLRMPAVGYTSQSQVIQEFPTQATTKLCDRTTLKSVKSGGGSNSSNSHQEDFPDEIDLATLASLCETDSSFSDSPVRRVKTNSYPGKTVASDRNDIRNPGHSDYKQPKLQEGAKTTKVTTPAHSSTNWRKTTSAKSTSAASSGLVFPPFANHPQENSRPLSSLAMGNTVTEKRAVQPGRKFTFKPLSSSSSSASSGQLSPSDSTSKLGAMSTINKPSTSAGINAMNAASSLDVSCSQLKLNGAESDDMMEDDPLYESQIMAILDQVESQATQQMASTQGCYSQEISCSPPRCSQEEIEKKRQAAMQRRLRSKCRSK